MEQDNDAASRPGQSDAGLCEHGCLPGELCKVVPCPALLSVRPEMAEKMCRALLALLSEEPTDPDTKGQSSGVPGRS